MVVGAVGSGKSSFLSALLGEMRLQEVRTRRTCTSGMSASNGTLSHHAHVHDRPASAACMRSAPSTCARVHTMSCVHAAETLTWPSMLQGDRLVYGRCSYTAQNAWIQNATVRDNILMGRDFDAAQYAAVIAACALQSDFDLLAAGTASPAPAQHVQASVPASAMTCFVI